MQRAVWGAILAAVLMLSALAGASLAPRVSLAGEAVIADVPFIGTLSFELPIKYRVTDMALGKVEGPIIVGTLTKKDGTSETHQNTPDYFNFSAYSFQPGGDHPDLRAFIQEKNPDLLDQENIFKEGDITVHGDAGISYPGYYISSFVSRGPYHADTCGYLAVLIGDGWVVSLDIYYFVQWQDSTIEQGTWTYTVDGQSLIPKHKADLAAMIASVKVSGHLIESGFTSTIPPPISTPVLPTETSSQKEQTSPVISTETSPPKEQTTITIIQAQGEVFIKEPGSNDWKPASPSGGIISASESYAVRTGQGTLRLKNLPSQGDQVFVGENTEVRIEEHGTVLEVLLGKIRVLIEKLSPQEPEYKFKTPKCAMSVRGTDFITDTTTERTDILVFEGAVELSDLERRKTVIVKAGESSTVAAGGLPSEPQKLDSATVFQKYESLFESDKEINDVLGNIEKPAKDGATTSFLIYLLPIPVVVIAVVVILVMRRRRRA